MKRLSCYLLLILLATTTHASGQPVAKKQPDQVSGTIRRVTLYRDRALVTREIKVPQGAKYRSVTVPDLPELVMTDSVFADGNGRTLIRAVRVSERHNGGSQRAEIQALDKQRDELTAQRAETQQALTVVTRDLELLTQLINFSVTSGKSDLNRGVLDAKTLTELTDYSIQKHRELAAEKFRHLAQLEQLDKKLQQVNASRNQATNVDQKSSYEAKIFVETPPDAAGTIHLSYLVRGCGWSPQYSVRGRIDKKEFELRYSAVVQQMSGEDWSDVDLTLSTASPSGNAARPRLAPLNVSSVDPSVASSDVDDDSDDVDPFSDPDAAGGGDVPAQAREELLSGMLQSLRSRRQNAETMLSGGFQSESTEQRDLALNSLAGQLQQIELQARSKSWRMLAPDVNNDMTSQEFPLTQPVSLDSRREQQLVQILETDLAGEMYHVATPLLSTYAYREAQMTNTQPIGLVAGPASIYLDDRFVGRTEIPATASGQLLTIGFGADQQVRTRRELLDKQDVVQGGNRQLKFVYRLVLANFKDRPVTVRLMDRMPNTRQSQQLSVRLEEPKQSLSDDALYQRILRPTGILRWDIELPEGRHGSQAMDIQYSYTMEFDRSRVPTTQHSLAELRVEYQNAQMPGGMGGFGGGGFGGGFGGP